MYIQIILKKKSKVKISNQNSGPGTAAPFLGCLVVVRLKSFKKGLTDERAKY